MVRIFRLRTCCWLLSILLYSRKAVIAASPNDRTEALLNMAPTRGASQAPSVLSELKGTIKKQQSEINTLKKAMKSDASNVALQETIKNQQSEIDNLRKQLFSTVATISHGGHGGGAPASQEELAGYLHSSFYGVAMSRVGWLSLFMLSLSLTAVIINGFEHTLAKHIELAYFVPLLAGHGGNAGGQTIGVVLSALSSKSVTVKDAPRVIAKEAMAGLMGGSILGLLFAPTAYYAMGISKPVSIVILFIVPWVSIVAAILGSTIPFACSALGLDASVISAPAMTSAVDVIGLVSYFIIANKIFALFGLEL